MSNPSPIATIPIQAYRFALDQVAMVMIVDPVGRIQFANPFSASILKYNDQELLNLSFEQILYTEKKTETWQEIMHTLLSGDVYRGDLLLRSKDGKMICTTSTIVPEFDASQNLVQIIIIQKDITRSLFKEEGAGLKIQELNNYKYALDQSSIVAITDQKGVIQYVNDTFCQISGYTRRELIGQDHRIINSRYHPPEFFKTLWKTIASGKIWKGEIRNKAKNGEFYWVDTTIVPFLSPEGKPVQYIAIRSDITPRKLAELREHDLEQRISEHNRHFYNVLDRIADGFLMLDKDFNYVQANKKIGQMTGRDVTSLIGQNIWKQFPEAVGSATYNAFLEAFKTQRYVCNVDYFAPFDLWQENHIYPSSDGISVFIRDISAQKKAEEKLVRSENIYRTITSSIPGTSIVLLDVHQQCLLVEGEFVARLGYDKKHIQGKNLKQVVPEGIYRLILPHIEAAFAGHPDMIETVDNGYDLTIRFVPLRNNDRIYAVMLVGNDISTLKQVQRELAEINSALENKVLERTRQLERVNRELESFSYSVAHDLRSPLRALSGYATILLEDYPAHLDAEGKRFLREVDFNAKKMGSLIDDLLTFSRLGRKEIQFVPVHMNELVNACIVHLREVHIRLPQIEVKPLPILNSDASLLRQVIINLLSNAVKYSSKNPSAKIVISATENENYHHIQVKDNGVGFEMQFSHKLFGVFQRLHSESEFEGTGVGLAIVKRIIERHNGEVWAEGSPNEGASFSFSIPKTHDEGKN